MGPVDLARMMTATFMVNFPQELMMVSTAAGYQTSCTTTAQHWLQSTGETILSANPINWWKEHVGQGRTEIATALRMAHIQTL